MELSLIINKLKSLTLSSSFKYIYFPLGYPEIIEETPKKPVLSGHKGNTGLTKDTLLLVYSLIALSEWLVHLLLELRGGT